MEYVLQTNTVRKEYGHFKALNGLSMNVPKGSIYGFVGKNGSGKTTLIRLACGLQQPTEGEIKIYGVGHKDRAVYKARRRIGAVVETPSIYLDMTAEENLKEQYRILGMPSFDDIGALLHLVGLENTGKKKARNFSLGMRQRLGIAIALAGNPDFLILDKLVHEISAAELEVACRKCTEITVSDTKILSRVLDKMGLDYSIKSDTHAEIYGNINVTDLTLKLFGEHCSVQSVNERNENLETFYINLVGGGKDE